MLLLSYNDALTKKKGRLVMTCARVHTLLHECTNAQATHACTCEHAKTHVNHANVQHTHNLARAHSHADSTDSTNFLASYYVRK